MDSENQNTEERNPVKTEKVDEVMEVIEHTENSAQDLVLFISIESFSLFWQFYDSLVTSGRFNSKFEILLSPLKVR